MAIKINGTTVIDDSRNLANVGGLKTVNGTSLVGSGNISAGASTTAGAVGTYGIMRNANPGYFTFATYVGSTTVAGSSICFTNLNGGSNGGTASGTWRCLYSSSSFTSGEGGAGLWVRIS